MRRLFSAVMITALFILSTVASAQETIRLSIGNSVRDDLLSKLDQQFTKETGIKVEYVKSPASASAQYLKELIEGKCDAAVASLGYEDWITQAKAAGVDVPANVQLTNRVIARNTLDIVAHKSAEVRSMTMDQVIGVLSGKHKSWKNVGGKDLPIKIVFPAEKAAGRKTLEKTMMKGEKFTKDFIEVPKLKDMLNKIDETPGAASFSAVKPTGANSYIIETPELGRPVTMISVGRPSDKLEKLINFVRKHGPAILDAK